MRRTPGGPARGRRAPGRRPVAPVVALVLVLALVAGCGSGADEPGAAGTTGATTDEGSPDEEGSEEPATAEGLAGTSWVSASVSGHELLPGTHVDLELEGGTMSASAGCNTVFGAYAVEDGRLRWAGEPASTLVDCPGEQGAQDLWLAALLADGVEATTRGLRLTLRSGEVTVVLDPQEPGADLAALLGRTWVVVGTLSEGVTRRVPDRGRRPSLVVGGDGLARVDTGCNTGRTVVRVDGDAFVLGPTTTTRQRCPQPDREIERRVLAVLDGRTDSAVTDGAVLVLTRGEEGLVVDVR